MENRITELEQKVKWLTEAVAKLQQAHVSSSALYDEFGEERYNDYDEDDSEDLQEQWEEERFDRLSQCTCGAWQVVNWELIHVADCCCGAE